MIIFRFLCSRCRGRGLEVKSFKKIDARDRASRKTKRSSALLVAPRSYAPHTLLFTFLRECVGADVFHPVLDTRRDNKTAYYKHFHCRLLHPPLVEE